MPRPPKAIDRRFVTKLMILEELPRLPLHLRRRLQAIRLIYDNLSTEVAANVVGVTRRTAQRWLAVWNNHGADVLLKRVKRGPKRKITEDQFRRELYPLILTAEGKQMTTWSLAEVQRRLAKKTEIRMSYSTLRRIFRRFGYRPPVPPRKLRTEQPTIWNHPWPREYGRSLTDYLRQHETAFDGGASGERPSR